MNSEREWTQDEIDDGAFGDELDDSSLCSCGAFPDEEEMASNCCSCCGKAIE